MCIRDRVVAGAELLHYDDRFAGDVEAVVDPDRQGGRRGHVSKKEGRRNGRVLRLFGDLFHGFQKCHITPPSISGTFLLSEYRRLLLRR